MRNSWMILQVQVQNFAQMYLSISACDFGSSEKYYALYFIQEDSEFNFSKVQ